MNVLVPVFVAVFLAEIGGPLAVLGRERRAIAGIAMALLLGLAAFAGWSIGELLVTPARICCSVWRFSSRGLERLVGGVRIPGRKRSGRIS